jgi:hypothetical protein
MTFHSVDEFDKHERGIQADHNRAVNWYKGTVRRKRVPMPSRTVFIGIFVAFAIAAALLVFIVGAAFDAIQRAVGL